MKTLPNTVSGLIEELDQQWPPRCIGPEESLRAADRYAGRRDLVEELKARQQATEKRALRDALTKI